MAVPFDQPEFWQRALRAVKYNLIEFLLDIKKQKFDLKLRVLNISLLCPQSYIFHASHPHLSFSMFLFQTLLTGFFTNKNVTQEITLL